MGMGSGMTSGVKRVWMRHQWHELVPFLDIVRHILCNCSHDGCQAVSGLYPNKAQLARIAAARDEHMGYCGRCWGLKVSANGVPHPITEHEATTQQQALQASQLPMH